MRLFIIENKAIYKGSGMLNDEEGYGFMVTAIDGDVDDGDGVDHFIIEIWESESETTVFSNDIEDPEYSTAIEKGSIKIHKPRYGSKAHN